MVAAAGRALAALDATAQQLPNPYLLRTPSLRREAQSTSALEGTYAPLREVLTADDDAPTTAEMTEILNSSAWPTAVSCGRRRGAPSPCHSSRTFKASSCGALLLSPLQVACATPRS